MRQSIAKITAPARIVTKPVYIVYKKSPHIEHIGFVSLAAGEIFHVGTWLLVTNIVLLIAGGMAVCLETFHLWDGKEKT
jgi:hypothetical protein